MIGAVIFLVGTAVAFFSLAGVVAIVIGLIEAFVHFKIKGGGE